MTNEEKISKLMDITGKGPMACGISLSMAGGKLSQLCTNWAMPLSLA
jgi:hypothetical protein